MSDKKSLKTADPAANSIIYNETAIRNNFTVLEFCRTCQSAASGMASGILGLTGTWGFVFYFVCVLLQVNNFFHICREGSQNLFLEIITLKIFFYYYY